MKYFILAGCPIHGYRQTSVDTQARFATVHRAPGPEAQRTKIPRRCEPRRGSGMRLLSRAQPDISGPEVEAWQRFLSAKGLYHGPIDGDFDAAVTAATREYQKESRLTPDGVLGPRTIERALRDGFKLPASGGDPHYVAAGDVVLSMEARSACQSFTRAINSRSSIPSGTS